MWRAFLRNEESTDPRIDANMVAGIGVDEDTIGTIRGVIRHELSDRDRFVNGLASLDRIVQGMSDILEMAA